MFNLTFAPTLKQHFIFQSRRLWLVLALLIGLTGGSAWLAADARRDANGKGTVEIKVDTSPLPRAADASLSFSPIVKRVTPSVVKVITREPAREAGTIEGSPFDDPSFRQFFGPFFGGPGQRRALRQPPQIGLGSGVIVSPDGYILTNNHVVDGADKVKVTLADQRELDARVIGRDEKTDIAVIKVEARDLPAVTFADSDGVEVGDRVLAVGNPFGIGQSVTTGIVSAKGRAAGAGIDYEDFIQTDAAINPGNSGGALVDMQGRLIGINTLIFSRSGGFQGIGFAIPSDLARSVMNSLVRDGKVVRGFLGVLIQDLTPALAEQFKLKSAHGALVSQVNPDGPADKAGLQSGDIITEFDGKAVEDSRRLKFTVAATEPGREVKLRVLRDGKERTIEAKIGELPGEKRLAENSGSGKDDGVLDGVAVSDLNTALRNEFNIPPGVRGALVTEVDPASASALAGLSPGDVIQEINHHPVRSADDAIKLTEKTENPKTLVKVWSGGATRYLVVDESDQHP